MGAQTDVIVPRVAALPQWAGVLLPPAAWALDLCVSYALVGWSCRSQQEPLLRVISLVALAGVVIGAVTSWATLQLTPSHASTDGGRPEERSRFMAVLGLTSSALFGLAIVATAIPRWVLHACN